MLLLALLACPSGGPKDAPVATDDTACPSPATWYADADGDGYGDAANPVEACSQPDGAVEDATDCDDSADAVHPGATEIWYDGADEDCSGGDDFDQDGDGYARDEECDDTDASRYPDPSVPEIWYDGVDENCDGNDGDQDGDGFYVKGYAYAVPTGYGSGDCWDDPASSSDWEPLNGFDALPPDEVHPGASDIPYDGLDADCQADSDFDADGDGHRTDTWPDESGLVGDDCDDTDPAAHNGAPEIWYDGVDEDCTGGSDFDQDFDGYDAEGGSGAVDCDDLDARISPGAREACGGTDEDCDGLEGEPGADGCTTYYEDGDGDGYGTTASVCACAPSDPYASTSSADCDDADPARYPGAPELCDGIDNGCTGGWTAASEAGRAAEVSSDGRWTDVTATLAAGTVGSPASYAVSDEATLYVCAGDWFVHLTMSGTSGAIVGSGAAVTTLDAGSTGRVLTGGGAGTVVSVRDVTVSGGLGDYGGGIAFSDGTITVDGVSFSGNEATVEGAGLYVYQADATVSGCSFYGNVAGASGGGLAAEVSDLLLTDSTFDGNRAGPGPYASGGALTFIAGGAEALVVERTSFVDSQSTATSGACYGGAAYLYQGGTASMEFTDTTFDGSTCTTTDGTTGEVYGGAIEAYLWGGDTTFTRVTIARSTGNGGAGVYGAGAAFFHDAANTLTFLDSAITDSVGVGDDALGGGLFLSGYAGAEARFSGTTIADNSLVNAVGGTNGWGGGIYTDAPGYSLVFDGSVLSGNATTEGAGILASLSGGAELILQNGSEIVSNAGDGIRFNSADTASTVSLVDSRIINNDGDGVYMTADGSAAEARFECTGSAAIDAGVYENGEWGVEGACGHGAACVVYATVCDFENPSTGVGNGITALSLYSSAWPIGADATFTCDGTTCR